MAQPGGMFAVFRTPLITKTFYRDWLGAAPIEPCCNNYRSTYSPAYEGSAFSFGLFPVDPLSGAFAAPAINCFPAAILQSTDLIYPRYSDYVTRSSGGTCPPLFACDCKGFEAKSSPWDFDNNLFATLYNLLNVEFKNQPAFVALPDLDSLPLSGAGNLLSLNAFDAAGCGNSCVYSYVHAYMPANIDGYLVNVDGRFSYGSVLLMPDYICGSVQTPTSMIPSALYFFNDAGVAWLHTAFPGVYDSVQVPTDNTVYNWEFSNNGVVTNWTRGVPMAGRNPYEKMGFPKNSFLKRK